MAFLHDKFKLYGFDSFFFLYNTFSFLEYDIVSGALFCLPIKADGFSCLLESSVAYIYILDTYQRNDNRRMTNDRRTKNGRKKTSLEKYSPLTLLQGFERVIQGLHVRGCWRPNKNFIFWPHCYDRHVVSFLFSWCWGLLQRGFPRAPSVGCGLPYHIWSLAVWNSTGNCLGSPNSTELNNNLTPTRSPTGSLKSNV